MSGRVVVVGGGPAGMRAAVAAADAGAVVLLVDAAPAIGGQYHRQLPAGFAAARPGEAHHGWSELDALRRRIEQHPRIEHLPDTTVWAVEPGPLLHLQHGPADAPGRRTSVVAAAALVIATGAHDRVLPFPGWDLPGVFTAGAAQAMAKGQRVAVGRRVLVAGTGPFLLPVAESLLGVGARVVAVAEANAIGRSLRGCASNPRALPVQAGKTAELARYAAVLARHRVPYRPRTAVVVAHGTDALTAVTTARVDADWREIPGTRRTIPVDALCVGHGFTPQLEVAIAAGCRIEGDFVEVSGSQATSVPGVFAAGEITGIGGAVLAADEGTLAGLAAARFTGMPAARLDRAMTRAARRVRRGRAFAAALAAAYPIGSGWREWLNAGTLVCRCEEVPYSALADAIDTRGATGLRSLKLICRAGLGPCQGRICGRNVTDLADALLADAARARGHKGPTTGDTPGHKGPTNGETAGVGDRGAVSRRPVVTPIRLGDLARHDARPRDASPGDVGDVRLRDTGVGELDLHGSDDNEER